LAELILKTEASGVLNWLLDGATKLLADRYHLTRTQEQEQAVDAMIDASASSASFLRAHIITAEGAALSITELYKSYAQWCFKSLIEPQPSRYFSRDAKDYIGLATGLRFRHDLGELEGGTPRRGWIGLKLREDQKAESDKIASAASAASDD
jgi:hypothetical protein